MSTSAALDYESVSDADDVVQYRALHSGALIGLVLGVASIFVVITAATSLEYCLLVTPIPVLGILFSSRALVSISRNSELYTGRALALAGLALSLVFLFVGVAYGGYVYATELRDGYERISFRAMRPDEIQLRNGQLVPPEIVALNGKRVMIKGYIRPDSITVSKGIDRFLLVRDNNQCCFGSLSDVKYYDQMDVTMVDSKTVDYSDGVFRMHGVLAVSPENAMRGPQYPVFTMKAEYAD
jgi:hypothetical protein